MVFFDNKISKLFMKLEKEKDIDGGMCICLYLVNVH